MTAPDGAGPGHLVIAPPAGRLRRAAERYRRPAFGIAGQVLNAGTNVATAYVASLLLAPDAFGEFVIAFACVTVVAAAGRGLVGSTMMVHLPQLDEADQRALVRSALGFTLLAGLGASLLMLAAGPGILVWFAPWVTVALLQDVGRYAFLAAGHTGRACALDAAWALAQGLTLAVWLLGGGHMSAGLIATAWGVGALAGLVTFAVLADARPAHPAPWTRAIRDVAGWFTGVAIVGQAEIYLVLLLTGALLGPADVGGVRAVQLLAYQPALVLLASLLTLVTPGVVRARSSPVELRRASRRISIAVTPVIVLLALLALLREPLMAISFGQYAGFAGLIVPIAVQSAFVALAVAPLAVMRGLRQGASVFVLQVVRTAAIALAARRATARAG